jgi:predicted PurR-regulated permease PerM
MTPIAQALVLLLVFLASSTFVQSVVVPALAFELLAILVCWMWGIIGALLAVPLLVCFKIICDHFENFRPVAEFLTV